MRSWVGLIASVVVVLTFALVSPVMAAHRSVDLSSASLAKKSCTPGYSPCIANKTSDVDCDGGGGNGPRYTARGVTYTVTGSDPYRLDADHDHLGCEPYGR